MVDFKSDISVVPQGSILGPLLFILLMNDIPLGIEEGVLEMYAEDSTVSVSGKTIIEFEKKVLKLHKRAERLIYDLPGREHSGPLFKKLK